MRWVCKSGHKISAYIRREELDGSGQKPIMQEQERQNSSLVLTASMRFLRLAGESSPVFAARWTCSLLDGLVRCSMDLFAARWTCSLLDGLFSLIAGLLALRAPHYVRKFLHYFQRLSIVPTLLDGSRRLQQARPGTGGKGTARDYCSKRLCLVPSSPVDAHIWFERRTFLVIERFEDVT
jgi:hypothetical protein